MNTLETLLQLDAGQVKAPTKEVQIGCKKLGTQLTFELKSIHPEKMADIQSKSFEIDKKGNFKQIDHYKLKVLTLIEACDLFKDSKLMKHFKQPTPKDLVGHLLLSGEIDELFNQVGDLNKGFEITDEEVKN